MKQVIEQYGKFILSSIIVFAVLYVIFEGLMDNEGNRGIFAVIGAQIKVDNVNYNTYVDFQNVYKAESEKEAPQIRFENIRLITGIHALSNYIKAVDYAGNPLAIKVLSVCAPDGTNLLASYNNNTTEFLMSQVGIYTAKVLAVDDGNRTTEVMIQIPINSN